MLPKAPKYSLIYKTLGKPAELISHVCTYLHHARYMIGPNNDDDDDDNDLDVYETYIYIV